MNGWERWSKRLVKGLLWCPVYFGLAWTLGIDPTWKVLALVLVCALWSDVLDDILPTAERNHAS